MALGYREHAAEFTERNVVLFGIHDGSLDAARQWVEKEQLPFAVLNDPDRRVGIELEIWPETPILPKPLFSWRRLPM